MFHLAANLDVWSAFCTLTRSRTNYNFKLLFRFCEAGVQNGRRPTICSCHSLRECSFSAIRRRLLLKFNAETVFSELSPSPKSKFQCQYAYFKVSCDIPHGNRRKNGVCFTKFCTHEGDVLGVRHRLNALPHVVRQSSWPRQLTSMSTFLTDVRTCVCESA